MILVRTKIISDKNFFMEKIMIKKIELREYQLESDEFIDCNDCNDCNDDYGIKSDSMREQKQQRKNTNNYEAVYSIFLHVTTDKEEIEVDYLGKFTKDKYKFDECFNFLCNYQGISSTINRLILEIKNNIL